MCVPSDDSLGLAICAFAPLADALRLAMTGRHWRRLLWLSDCDSLPNVLEAAPSTPAALHLTPARLDRLIARFGPGLTTLAIAAKSLKRGESMTSLAARLPSLRSLTVHSCEGTSFSSIGDSSSAPPPLLRLCVEGGDRLRPPLLAKFIAPGCLRELRLTGAPLVDAALLRALAKAKPPLVSLELVECGSLDEDVLVKLLAALAPTLEVLDLSGCGGFGALAVAMPRLRHLRLACCPRFGAAGVRCLGDSVHGCPRLCSLDLRHCPRALADGGAGLVEALASGCSDLASVFLDGAAGLTEAHARHMVTILAQRPGASLSVEGCRGVPRDLRLWVAGNSSLALGHLVGPLPAASKELAHASMKAVGKGARATLLERLIDGGLDSSSALAFSSFSSSGDALVVGVKVDLSNLDGDEDGDNLRDSDSSDGAAKKPTKKPKKKPKKSPASRNRAPSQASDTDLARMFTSAKRSRAVGGVREDESDDDEWDGSDVDEVEDYENSEEAADTDDSDSEAHAWDGASDSESDFGDSDDGRKRRHSSHEKKVQASRAAAVKMRSKQAATKGPKRVAPAKATTPTQSTSASLAPAGLCGACGGKLKGLCIACKPQPRQFIAKLKVPPKPPPQTAPKARFLEDCAVCHGNMRGLCVACRLPPG